MRLGRITEQKMPDPEIKGREKRREEAWEKREKVLSGAGTASSL